MEIKAFTREMVDLPGEIEAFKREMVALFASGRLQWYLQDGAPVR